jgi:uncharacterized protein
MPGGSLDFSAAYVIVLLKKGPKREELAGEKDKLVRGHLDYIRSLATTGKLVIAGPFVDDGPVRGVFVFNTSPEEATALATSDPGVRAGYLDVEVHPWWAAADLGANYKAMCEKTAPEELPMAQYQFAFLTRGPKWTPERTPETAKIQEGHMANINRLYEEGKLHAAGPFADDGDLRGVFVFKVGSIEEARALSETDPAVKAGRLALDLHPWMIAEGLIPKPPAK